MDYAFLSHKEITKKWTERKCSSKIIRLNSESLFPIFCSLGCLRQGMQYFRHIVSKEPAFPGVAGTGCKVSIQLCDLKAKPLCVKHSGTSKIEQGHLSMWRWLSRSLRPTVIWQIKAVCGCLSFQDILLKIKKNYKLMIFCCWVIILAALFAFPPNCWFDTWAIELLPSHGYGGENQDGDLPPGARSRHGCVSPPASPQMSEIRINVLLG